MSTLNQDLEKRVERQKSYLANRQAAYQALFAGGNDLEEVMNDLKFFCRARDSCFDADPRVHAVLEGRREVYQRIEDHLELSFDELWDKQTKGE